MKLNEQVLFLLNYHHLHLHHLHPFTLALAVSPTLSVSLSVNPTPKPHGLTIHRWAITSSSPRDSRGGR